MKRLDLENKLKSLGWSFLRQSGYHDLWTDGDRQEAIPRHPDINKRITARYSKKS